MPKIKPSKSIVSVSSLYFSYGENDVLEDISFEIKDDDFIALVGPNGAGKTTLVKLMLGLLTPAKGKITYSISREKVGYTPQRYTIDKNFPGRVDEILSEKDEELIRQVGIADLLKKKFVNLSGGQQQKVLIALALEKNPRLLILDEPTAGVDVNSQQSFYSLLKRLNEKGIAILLVTHEVGVIPTLVKNVLCVNHKFCGLVGPQEMPSLLKEMYGKHFIHQHGGVHHHD